MANGTIQNLIFCIVSFILGTTGLIGAVFFSAWWHLITCIGCYAFTWIMFTDDAYDVESVRHYLQSKKSKRNDRVRSVSTEKYL